MFHNLRRKDGERGSLGEDETTMLQNVTGWQIRPNEDESLSLIRMEDWLLDGQRVVTEIQRRHEKNTNNVFLYSIHSHGCKVDAEQLTGMKLGQFTNSAKEEIQLLASFMSTSQLCKGVKVNDSDAYYGSNRVAVYTSLSDPDAHELRAFSSNCRIICPPGSRCSECSRVRKYEVEKRKKADSRGELHPKHNNRYLTRQQLQVKFENEKKDHTNAKLRGKRFNAMLTENMIELSDDDHAEFSTIMSKVRLPENAPEGMEILWEQQTKLLATASTHGYWWHPK